jgi:hypothetical protein
MGVSLILGLVALGGAFVLWMMVNHPGKPILPF